MAPDEGKSNLDVHCPRYVLHSKQDVINVFLLGISHYTISPDEVNNKASVITEVSSILLKAYFPYSLMSKIKQQTKPT